MKTEVYSWRVSTDLKMGLEHEARRRKISLSAVLDLAARELLRNSGANGEPDKEQERLQGAAAKCLGTIAGSNPRRAESVKGMVRTRLRGKHER